MEETGVEAAADLGKKKGYPRRKDGSYRGCVFYDLDGLVIFPKDY